MEKYLTKTNIKNNRMILIISILSIIFVSIWFVQVYKLEAAFNKQINYQGKLTTSANVAVTNGTYNMEFKLYDSGSTVVWTETRTGANKVQVTSGLFSVMLGEVAPLTGVNFNQTLYLGVNIGGTSVTPAWDGEMSPRKKLGTVPSAVESENAVNATKATNIAGGNSTTLLGSIPYQSNTDTTTLLSPNTTIIKKFFSMTGTGTNGAIPTWNDVTATDVGLGNVTNESKATMFTSPTFTGTVVIPSPFTLGATSVTTTGTRLNYLTSAAGTTGTTSTNLVFSTSPALTTPTVVTSIVGGATFSAFNTVTTNLSIGGAATTMTIGGTPTTTLTHNYSTNATASGATKTINLGTGGAAGSTTNINIGSTSGGTLTINNPITALGMGSLTMTGSLGATGARLTKGWFTDLEITNLPTINGVTLVTALGLSNYVPYTGATSNVDLGSYGLTVGSEIITKSNSTALTDLLINPTTKTSGNLIDAQVNGVSKFVMDYKGYIGMGRGVSSIYALTMLGDQNGDVGASFKNSNTGANAYTNNQFENNFGDDGYVGIGGGGNTNSVFTRRTYLEAYTGLGLSLVSDLGDIRLYTGGSTSTEERMRIDATGNVGIGTVNPLASLDVAGVVKIAGTGTETCDVSHVGTFRYNPATRNMQTCLQHGGSSLTYIGTASQNVPSGNTATFVSHPIGTASSDRLVVVAIVTEWWPSNVTGVTIGGVTATINAQGNSGSNWTNATIASANVPTGTTANVVVTVNSGVGHAFNTAIAVYTLTGLASTVPTGTSGVGGTNSLAPAVNVVNGGAVITVGTGWDFDPHSYSETASTPLTENVSSSFSQLWSSTDELDYIIGSASHLPANASFTTTYTNSSTWTGAAAVAWDGGVVGGGTYDWSDTANSRGTLVANKMCYTDGNYVKCDTTAPTLSAGNFGIGTTSPSQLLSVGSGNQFTVSSAGALYSQSATIGATAVAPIIVSGTGSGSPNGTYTYIGQYNGANSYQRGTDNMYISWIPSYSSWYLSNALGYSGFGFSNSTHSISSPPDSGTWVNDGTTGSVTTTAGTLSQLVVDTIGNMTSGGNLNLTGTGNSYMLGSLGIGTTSPTAKLDIAAGNLNLDNTTNTNQYGVISKGGTRFIHNFNYGNNGTVTTDGQNLFVGEAAGNFTMGSTAVDTYESSGNVGIGYSSLQNNTTGYGNSALGVNSLRLNTTGGANAAFGRYSLLNNTTGDANSAFGYNSLYSNIDGSSNVAIGYGAGSYITGGVIANTSGFSNVFIGNNTKSLSYDDQNEIVIGYNTIGNGSNTATIGNTSTLRTYLTGLNLKAGSATAGTSPLKFTSGTLLTTTEAGAIEYNGTHLYFTATNGGSRYQLDQQSVGGGATWDTIGDPAGNGAIAFGSTVQTMDWATATTQNALSINATSLTTGRALNIDVGSSITSGAAINVVSSGTSAITQGLVQIAHLGNFTGSGGLLNVSGDNTQAGTVAAIYGSSLTTGNALYINAGSSITSGSGLMVESGGTSAISSGLVRIGHWGNYTGTGGLLNVQGDSTNTGTIASLSGDSVTTGRVLDINAGANITSGSALYVEAGGTSVITNGLVRIGHWGNYTGTGGLLNVQGDSTNTGTIASLSGDSVTTGRVLDINAGANITSGSALYVEAGGTSAITSGLVQINHWGNYTGTGGLLQVSGDYTQAGRVMNIEATSLTTGTGLRIAAGNTLTSGSAINVYASGTSAISSGLVLIEHTGNFTGVGGVLQVSGDNTTAGRVMNVEATSLTTGTAFNINVGSNLTSGKGILVQGSGTSAITGSLITAYHSGNFTGTGGLLSVDGDNTTAGRLINVLATSLTTGTALYIDGGTTQTTGYSLWVDNGNARFDGNVGVGVASGADRLAIGGSTASGMTIVTNSNTGGSAYINLFGGANAANQNVGQWDFFNYDGAWTSANVGRIATLRGAGGAAEGYMTFSTKTQAGALGERMRIDPSGNVGIGTTTPSTALDVNGMLTVGTGTGITRTGSILLGDGYITKDYGQSWDFGGGIYTHGGGLGFDRNDIFFVKDSAGIDRDIFGARPATDPSTAFMTFLKSPDNDGDDGIQFRSYADSPLVTILNGGNVGIGTTTPTAVLHLKAGTATANTAPLKFTSGTLLGTTEAGAIEYNGTHLYFTASNGGSRYQLDQQSVGGGATWDTIGDPSGNGSIAMGSTVQNLDWATTTTQLALGINTPSLTTGRALSIDAGSSITSGSGLMVEANGTSAISNGLVRIGHWGNYTGTGGLLNVVGDSTTGGTIASLSGGSLTTGKVLDMYVGSSITSGNAIYVEAGGTSAIANGLVRINHWGNYTGTGGLLNVSAGATTTGTVASISAGALTTGRALSIDAGDSLTTGNGLSVTSGSTGNIANGLVRISNWANYTAGKLLQVDGDATQAGTVEYISADSLTTGRALNIEVGNSLTSGNALRVYGYGAAAISGGLVNILHSGDFTGQGGLLSVDGDSTTAGRLINVLAGSLTTGTALNINVGYDLTSGKGIMVQGSGTSAITGSLIGAYHSGNFTGAGGLLSVVGDSTTTGTIAYMSGWSLTTGTVLNIYAGDNLTDGSGLVVQGGGTSPMWNGMVAFRHDGTFAGDLLHVEANTTTTGRLTSINGTSLTTGTALYIDGGTSQTTGYSLWVDNGNARFDGNVGIGTTAPDRALEINSATGINLRLTYNDADGSAANYADLTTTSAGLLNIKPSGNILSLGGNTTATELRFMEPSGSGTNYFSIKAQAQTANTVYTWPAAFPGTAGYQLTSSTAGVLTWATASSTRDTKENIVPFIDPENALNQILNAQVYTFNYRPGMGTGDTETKYVGIMADEAPWAMHYGGNVINPVNTLGYMILGVQTLNNKIESLSSKVLDLNYDISSKKNIKTLGGEEFALQTIPDLEGKSTLEKMMNLTPVTYNFNSENDTDSKHIGFIAQEIEQVFPDLIITDVKTGLKSVSYSNLAPYLVKSIQDMNLMMVGINDFKPEDTIGDTNPWRVALTSWLGNAGNKITRIFTGEICLTDENGDTECINKNELRSLKGLINSSGTASVGGASNGTNTSTTDGTTSGTTDGTTSGTTDGTTSGTTDSTTSGTTDSTTSGTTDSTTSGTTDSTTSGTTDSTTSGTTDGTTSGTTDSTTSGTTDSTTSISSV